MSMRLGCVAPVERGGGTREAKVAAVGQPIKTFKRKARHNKKH